MVSNVVQELPSDMSSRRRSRDTGFSEPFSTDRNTTLTHPSANTGPNPTLSSADVPVSATASRRRYRRTSSKSKHNLGSGSIDVKDLQSDMYADIQYVDGTVEKKTPSELTREREENNEETDTSIVGRDSGVSGLFGSRESREGERKEELLASPERTPERKRGFLNKLHLHGSHKA